MTKRRQRLGGTTLSAAETRRRVDSDLLPSSALPGLYRAVLEDPDAGNDEELRRGTERKLLEHLGTLLGALPSGFDGTNLDLKAVEKRKEVKEEEERVKGEVRREVEELAEGMVLIGVPEERAWRVALDWRDRYGRWEEVDWREVGRYCELFPECVDPLSSVRTLVAHPFVIIRSGLSSIARALRQRLDAALPVDEDAEEPRPPPPSDDDIADIIEVSFTVV